MQSEQHEASRESQWVALVHMLRTELAKREVSGELEGTSLNEPLRNELTMTVKGGYLSVWLHTDTGEGSWNSISEKLDKAEPWFMSVDGSVELHGEKMDLATAAQRFIEMIS